MLSCRSCHLIPCLLPAVSLLRLFASRATSFASPPSPCRSHRLVTMESSVTLELQPPALHQDVCVRLVFAEPAAVPMLVRIEHGVSPAAKFEALGEIRLQPKSLRQLRHLFRLGRHVVVARCLRITCVGWLVPQHAGELENKGMQECRCGVASAQFGTCYIVQQGNGKSLCTIQTVTCMVAAFLWLDVGIVVLTWVDGFKGWYGPLLIHIPLAALQACIRSGLFLSQGSLRSETCSVVSTAKWQLWAADHCLAHKLP